MYLTPIGQVCWTVPWTSLDLVIQKYLPTITEGSFCIVARIVPRSIISCQRRATDVVQFQLHDIRHPPNNPPSMKSSPKVRGFVDKLSLFAQNTNATGGASLYRFAPTPKTAVPREVPRAKWTPSGNVDKP